MAEPKNDRKLLKEQLNLLDQVLQETHEMIQEEREKGPELLDELEQQLAKATSKHERIEKKLKRAKAQIKKRKREITEWKDWYNHSIAEDKLEELQQLNQEVGWRADEIATKEQEIAELLLKELEAEGNCEQLQLRIYALKEVDVSLPIAEDPRLVGIQEERQQLMQELDATA